MPHSFSYAVSMNLEHSIKEGSHERYPDHFQCFRNKKIKYPDFQAMTLIILSQKCKYLQAKQSKDFEIWHLKGSGQDLKILPKKVKILTCNLPLFLILHTHRAPTPPSHLQRCTSHRALAL